MKGSFDAYIESKGLNSQLIWDQIEDAIRIAILNKEPLLNGIVSKCTKCIKDLIRYLNIYSSRTIKTKKTFSRWQDLI